jgi:hypothetical protein
MKPDITPNVRNNKFLFNIILLIFSTAITLFVAEVALRIVGKKAGYVPRYSRFKVVEDLQIDSSYYTDSEGVFKANPDHPGWTDDVHINSDGFRGAEFSQQHPVERPKILFLGDSFTWGSSARPIDSCFVDIVNREGFVTFNTGIPGTDPNQYAFLAEKYIPLLKPDFVAVMFYLGNDFIAPRPMLPFKNLYHVTNAQFLYAFDEAGNYMSPQQAYEYYLAKNNSAAHAQSAEANSLKSRLRMLLMRTVVGTYLWVSADKLKDELFAGASEDDANTAYDPARKSLAKIKAACENAGMNFMLFVIPVHPGKGHYYTSVAHHQKFLNEFNAYVPDFLTTTDYMELPNAHFNNSGHRKYADFIIRSIKQIQDVKFSSK